MYGVQHPGDDGNTELSPGRRVSKDEPHIECLGALEELQAELAVLRTTGVEPGLGLILERVIQDLQDLMGCVAAPPEGGAGGRGPQPAFPLDALEFIERATERVVDLCLPQLEVLLPSGSWPAAQAIRARAVCRRAERRMVRLARDRRLPGLHVRYLNRLGDLLFETHRLLLQSGRALPITYVDRATRLAWSDHLLAGRGPGESSDGRSGT